jgi:thiamine-monophosphate kinase
MPGEFDFISWLRTQQSASPFVRVPAGDDLAVLDWPADLLIVGVDQVLDGVHFDSAIHTPRQIGAKVMNRNLSDCAAMACLPVAAVTTAALPRGISLDYAKELYLGMKSAADAFACAIVGGDTGSWQGKLALTVTILGRSAGIAPILRCGARPGDKLYVTGPLGGSIKGRHMTFTPLIKEARALAKTGHTTAMIDISDGLSRDLAHICKESNVGAIIHADKVPIHPDVDSGPDRLAHALNDGEDHELLFTANAPIPTAIEIGQITVGPRILIRTPTGEEPLTAKGWEHQL